MTSLHTPAIRILTASVLLIAVLTVLIASAATATAQNPVPFLDQPLVPDATAPGGPAFTVRLNGAGFVSASEVNWNGSPRATTFVSSSQLTAAILASDIATASTAAVTVVNPSHGGVSNVQFFSIAVAVGSVSFLPAVAYSSGGQPYTGSGTTSLAVADLRGNGRLDVVVANQGGESNGDGSAGVLLGKGDGTLQPVVTYDSGGVDPTSIAVADVNGDGKPDLLVVNGSNNTVAVLLGNGDGTFRSPVLYDSGGYDPGSIAVADVNGDGKLDIVVANYENFAGTGIIGVLLGNGDGTFEPPVTYGGAGLQGATWVAVADLNGDGKLDIAVAYQCEPNCYSSGAVGVLRGNGDGTFQPAVIYPSGGIFSNSVAVADVNGDGKPDLLVVNANSLPCNIISGCAQGGSVGVLLGNGNGTFQAAVAYDSGGNFASSVAVADVNGDGKPDLLVANGNSGTTGLLLGNGDGTFQTAATYELGYPGPDSVAVGDLTGEGRLDVVAGGRDPGMVDVLLNHGGSAEKSTTTVLTSLPDSSVYGQAVTFTALVTARSGAPAGTVLLYDGSTVEASGTVTNGRASITVSSLPVGANSVTAEYTGGGGFASSSSTPLTQTVSTATTTTTVTSPINPAIINQPVTFTATITSQFGGAATGSAIFYSGSQTLGRASLSGNLATLTTSFAAGGTYSISAKYIGNRNNAGSTSSIFSQGVNTTRSATSTALASTLHPSIYGQAITFTATVRSAGRTPPNGETVTFYWIETENETNGLYVLGTAPMTGGIASLKTSSLQSGIFTISAAYLGDANFSGSTSSSLQQAVDTSSQSATTTALTSSLNPSVYGQKVTWTATVKTSGSTTPTGKVNFNWGDFYVGTAALNSSGVATLTRSLLSADAYPMFAVYTGDANNGRSASPILNQVITQTTSAAAITASPNHSTRGQSVTFTARITSPTATPAGPVTFTAGKTGLGSVELSEGKAIFTTSTLAIGSTTVTVTYPWDSDISGSSAAVTHVVQH
jgi:hypothetical protein